MIKVNNLKLSYGSKEILKGLDFQIKENSIVGFLGENGAGKSTTMNIITGYIVPNSGEVFICDEDMINNPIAAKKNIGYLPEIPPLYKDMRIEEYLMFAARLKGVDDKNAEVNRVITLLDIEDKRYEFIKHLSKGYGQRVGFAQALLGNPKVLIFDEPLVGLDPAESKKTRELIKSLKDGHSILISSHILSEIEELCNDIIVIKDGMIVLEDSTRTAKMNLHENQYRLQIKGKRQQIEDTLSGHSNIKNVSFVREMEKDVFEFVVVSKNSRDMRDSLFSYLVGKKFNVYGITKLEASLEDVFLEANDREEE